MLFRSPVRELCPVEADFVTGLLALRQRRPEPAARSLVALFEALRRDPTPLPIMAEHAVRLALEIASQDPQQVPALFSALDEPFALLVAEESRTTVLCLLGSAIGPREMVEALQPLEPNPPWNARMLELRAEAYEATGHALAGRARRDWNEFQAHAGKKAGPVSD